MTIQNIQIDGVGSFNNTTENAGVVTYANFGDTATNSGTISVSAEFSLSAANHGTVTQVAVFIGDAVNTGTVAVAEFKDNAVNAGTVSTSAVFADSTSNTGTVAAAQFVDTAKNDGGTVTGAASFADTAENIGTVGGNAVFTGSAENKGAITGDAIFADTTVNTGSVSGNAQVASTADNSGGTVTGSVTQYKNGYYSDGYYVNNLLTGATDHTPQYTGNEWYVFGSTPGEVSFAAGFFKDATGIWYAFYGDGTGTQNISYGFYLINGNGYEFNSSYDNTGNYQFFTGGDDAIGVYASGTHQTSNGNWYTFDGAGNANFATGITSANGTYYRYDGAGGRSQVYYISNSVLVTGNGAIYSSSSVLAIGTITYASNGETNPNSFAVSDLSYTVAIDGSGEIDDIVNTNPYN